MHISTSTLLVAWIVILTGLLLPRPTGAVEARPALTDREIAECLARLEEGQAGRRADMKQLREDMTGNSSGGHYRLCPVGPVDHAAAPKLKNRSERSVRSLEEDIGSNRQRLDALVEAFRALGQHNPEVAGVLRQFHLL